MPPLTLLNIPSSSIDYKTASLLPAYLLHGSSYTSRIGASLFALVAPHLQRLHTLRVFHRGLCLVPCFSHYISPIAHIVSSFGLLQQQYAADTQLYVAISKDNYFLALNQLEHCLVVLHTWFWPQWPCTQS